MRSQADLVSAFDSVDSYPVDPDDMLVRIHAGSAALQTERRRRVAALSVAAAAILIAVGAVIVPSLGNDRADRDQVATTPTPSTPAEQENPEQPMPAVALDFSPGERPPSYTTTYSFIQPGLQLVSFETPIGPEASREVRIQLLDPEVSGQPTPVLTGETVLINSLSQGPLTANVIQTGTVAYEEPTFGIDWQAADGRWFVVTSDAPSEQARTEVVDVAEQIDLRARAPFTYPFQLGFVPEGVKPIGGLGSHDANGNGRAGLDFGDDPRSPSVALQVWADGAPDLANFAPNTTVGPYQAQLTLPSQTYFGATLVMIVDGFLVTIDVTENYVDVIDEQELRRIAEELTIIPGADSDDSVWTDQPLG
ncbi:MAG: hypothetical protein M3400_02380 [Actinomycetota bacterium]|nr:hypothetical protein [Actinomycetota bacterium]